MHKLIESTTLNEIIPLENFIPAEHLEKAKAVEQFLLDNTREGSVYAIDGTNDQDKNAADFLKNTLAKGDIDAAYGFMLYAREPIVKCYWKYYCGTNRKNKKQFFNKDVYYEWLLNIFECLTNTHEHFSAITSNGREVGPLFMYNVDANIKTHGSSTFDIAKSFRTWWVTYQLTELAKWLNKKNTEDPAENAESYDGRMESEAGREAFDAEMTRNASSVAAPEDGMKADAVEQFLKDIIKDPSTTSPVGTPKTNPDGVTAADIFKEIFISGETKKNAFLTSLNITSMACDSGVNAIAGLLDREGLTLEDISSYFATYKDIGITILSGKADSYRNYLKK